MTKKVIVYSTSKCPYCVKVKNYLLKNGIPFVEKLVDSDMNAANEMVKKTGMMSVPITEIDGQFVSGFNKDRIDELLGLTNS